MSPKKYFPSLNGVRFIAVFLVLIHHIEQAKYALDIPNIYTFSVVQHAGRLGVCMFFVLSGFLITYLLLQERGKYGDISASKFYLRRIFRIWPIYFAVILSSYFLFPRIGLLEYPGAVENVTSHYWERLAFLLLVLPNFAFVLYDLPYWCAQAWSIGVEEQFYYLWPWLIKIPKRRPVILAAFFGITAIVLLGGLYYLKVPPAVQLEKIGTFLGQFRIQVMALGGFTAWIIFRGKQHWLSFLFRRDVQIAVYTVLLILFFSGVHFRGFMEVYALFFAFFIVNVATNPRSVVSLEVNWISYLGKISYGIYLYHVIVTVLVLNLINRFLPDLSGWGFNLLLFPAVISLTILVCSLSYEYFEKPLLNFKDRRFGR